MNRKQKKLLARILAALVFFAVGLFLEGWWRFGFMAAAWLLTGVSVAKQAAKGLLRGQLLDENFLMTVASLGAFTLMEAAEGAAVMIFFQIGELFEDYAVNRSRKSIAAMMDLRPDTAVVLLDGTETEKDPEEVRPGDLLLVRPGQRVPVDGTVVEGNCFLDTAKITGEAEPREVGPGMAVLSGCVNLSGVLTIRAESAYEHSTVARILELVESASEKKAKAEQLITKFAHVYTPLVVGAAVLLALIPPLCFGEPFGEWVHRSLTFLVISCPCALVISVPMSFFGGMGAASKRGIVVKGGIVLEQLASLRQVVLDKTGTLTTGEFTVSGVYPQGVEEAELLRLVSMAERYSAHPAAQAICRNAAAEQEATEIEELPGFGVSALADGRRVRAGNRRLMEKDGIVPELPTDGATCVYVSLDGIYAGRIELMDTVKNGARDTVDQLRKLGISNTVMLTGDVESSARRVAGEVGLDGYFAGLLPQDKVTRLEEVMRQGGATAFVGDGVNDAPVLTMADVGIAMGGVGSEAAVEAADVVLLNDRLSGIADAIRIGRKTRRIAKENIYFALGVKLAILVLGALGIASMWLAVFADVGVAILAILNAMRTMLVSK
ncbi:MAG: heavy metal translocating P-type ATPase [Oscillospiraceae bacterium]|nr:heavy metal translocating P-type ATPase [Oscillospiraceae bacterium]